MIENMTVIHTKTKRTSCFTCTVRVRFTVELCDSTRLENLALVATEMR